MLKVENWDLYDIFSKNSAVINCEGNDILWKGEGLAPAMQECPFSDSIISATPGLDPP